MHENVTKELLQSSSYWVLNKYLVSVLGVEAASFLTILAEGEKILEKQEIDGTAGWFYQTVESVEELLNMKRKKQAICVSELVNYGIIEQKNKGVPMRRYFKINFDILGEIISTKMSKSQLVQMGRTRKSKWAELESPNGTNYKDKEHKYKEHRDKEDLIKIKSENKFSSDTPDDNNPLGVSPKELNNEFQKSIIGGRVIPKDFYLKFKKWISAWSAQPMTTKHNVAPQDKPQNQTVFDTYTYFQDATTGISYFFEKYHNDLDPSWVKKYGITRETVMEALAQQSSDKLLGNLMKQHLDAMHQNPDRKEDFTVIGKDMKSFFIYTRSNGEAKVKKTSWLLYWLCKPIYVEKLRLKREAENIVKPITKKYPDERASLYKAVDTVFGVNRNKLHLTETLLQNQCYTLTEALIDEIILKKQKLKEAGLRPGNIQVNMLYDSFPKFVLETKEYLTVFNPSLFLPTRKLWNNFIDWIVEKNEDKAQKDKYEVYKHEISTK